MSDKIQAKDSTYKIRTRDDWSRVFLHYTGWTGSDNTYSIPLPSRDGVTRTAFTFGDSFIGGIDPHTGARSADSVMVNNALGLYTGDLPDPDALEVLYGAGKRGRKAWSLFVPPMPRGEQIVDEAAITSEHINSPDDPNYYWLQDGLVEDGMLHILALRVRPAPEREEGFRFAIIGTDLLSIGLDESGLPDPESLTVEACPHGMFTDTDSLYFGAAILREQDSQYTYIYGLHQHNGANLVLARCPSGQISDFSSWRFRTERGWSDRAEDCAILASGISSECSVSKLDFGNSAGAYALIYNRNGVEPYVEMLTASAPEGPFGNKQLLYNCPEVWEGREIYCYNAKAHPELSHPGTLLISYNVNTRSDAWHMRDGRIYRTHWIELYADDVLGDVGSSGDIEAGTSLRLHPLLQSGAVLQRDVKLAIRGEGRVGAGVLLEHDGRSYAATVAADGQFVISLPPQAAGGPHRLRLTSGGQTITLDDVYFGDVYLAGGQSNMQLPFSESLYAGQDQALFQDPLLRAYSAVGDKTWQPLIGPAPASFSAVAAYSGLRLRELDPTIPIGLVGAYMGATSAACWTSAQTLSDSEDLAVYERDFQARIAPWSDPDTYLADQESFQARSDEWNRTASLYREQYPEAIESDLTAAIGAAPWPPPENQSSFMRPSGLYEDVLLPLTGASLCAAIFYQGESDVSYADRYLKLFAAMRGDWYRLFGEIPIVQVQLPAYAPDPEEQDDGSWGRLRDAQREASASLNRVRHVVALDQGQLGDLHPKNKRMIGLRLANVLQELRATSEGSSSGSMALDAYVESMHEAEGVLTLTLRKHPGMDLIYAPGQIGDKRDRKSLADSGFDLYTDRGERLAIPRDKVEIQGDKILLRVGDTPWSQIAYGARNRAVASVLTCPSSLDPEDRSLRSSLACLEGSLEAFIVSSSLYKPYADR